MDARWVTLHIAKGSFGQVAEALRLGKATALAATDIIFLREGLNFIFSSLSICTQQIKNLDARTR